MSIKILNPKHVRTESAKGGDSAQARVRIGGYREDALVLVSAKGSANYNGGGGITTGILLAIEIQSSNSTELFEDVCAEGQTDGMYFRSAASHNFVLRAGAEVEVAALVRPYGAGRTTDSTVSLSCYALALAPGFDGAAIG